MQALFEALREFNYRIEVNNDNEVEAEIKKHVDRYCTIVRRYSVELADIIDNINNLLAEALEQYFSGDLVEANNRIDSLLKLYKDSLYIHDLQYGNSINIYKDANVNLFKGRICEWNHTLNREDIFHIPYDLRKYVTTQRFSVPGVPCIYLGHSIYVIWEELGRPKDNDFFVSRFKVNDRMKVLDLGLVSSDIEEIKDFKVFRDAFTKEQLIRVFTINNVLKIACLVRVKEENRGFKSEYVLPQLILARATKTKLVDGIRYPSTKIKNDSYVFCNYAFPAMESTKEHTTRFSKMLADNIELTCPVNIGLFNSLMQRHIDGGRFTSENMYRDYVRIPLNNEVMTSYLHTSFYRLEERMRDESLLPLKSIGV